MITGRDVDAAIAIEQRATREREAREAAESHLARLEEALEELCDVSVRLDASTPQHRDAVDQARSLLTHSTPPTEGER